MRILYQLTSPMQRTVLGTAGHGADVLVPGCMSMGCLGVADDVQKRLEIPAALETAETLVALGLAHSRLAYPTPPKEDTSR
jgi:allantoin racemase